MKQYKEHSECRVCGSKNLIKYIDLGNLPLTNNLCETAEENAETFPLQVLLCDDCQLSQLSIVVDPELLFGNYVYRSSISKGYLEHCKNMAIDLQETYGLNKKSFHIDIAGNDGALLSEFKKIVGCRVLNVDPAKNMVTICEGKGIRQYAEFWGMKAANHLVNTDWPKADLITATNVVAHVDNLHDFFEGVKLALKPSGVFVMECPYIIDFIYNNEFDTIYQEHVSYMSIRPLIKLCDKIGLTVMKVEKEVIHGGSIRVHIGYGKQHESVKTFILENEYKLNNMAYFEFAEKSKKTISEFAEKLNWIKLSGFKIAGFAASAKGNTLLNCAGITNSTMSYIVDETPEKIGKYSPGTHIPIVSMIELEQNPPDFLVILSWNFSDEIISKCKNAGYKRKFIIPIPDFKIID